MDGTVGVADTVGTGVDSGPLQAASSSTVKAQMKGHDGILVMAYIILNLPDQTDFPEHVSSWIPLNIKRHPERVNCHPIR